MIDPFITSDWLHEHLGQVVVADVRWYLDGRAGLAEYHRGHVPGAVFVDLDAVLAAAPSAADGRHPLPEPETFAAALAELGIGDEDTVVAYDDAGGVIAARLVWMLRATGHEAAVLDGGIGAWAGPLETGPPAVEAVGRFTARPWPRELLATIDEVASPSDSVLLDARDGPRFRGESEPVDPRPGHIPGARSLPVREHLGSDGRLLAVDELRARFEDVGVDRDVEVISSCGSGVTACHNLLLLEHLGLRPGRLYPGSWSQWSADPARPSEVGEDPAGR
ncbi:MAG TPA: sulfurtransferase [Solirubrobacteraceae bacterium]|nr:sulfurtransferase [Solirubrobacteraceae bacterium]